MADFLAAVENYTYLCKVERSKRKATNLGYYLEKIKFILRFFTLNIDFCVFFFIKDAYLGVKIRFGAA